MILEYTALLQSTYNEELGYPSGPWPLRYKFNKIMRPTHTNHPCAKWARKNRDNWQWLWYLVYYLCYEYKTRYNKEHSYYITILQMGQNPPEWLKKSGISKRPQCFGPFKEQCYIKGKPMKAYRLYYLIDKIRFAKWPKDKIPKWFKI